MLRRFILSILISLVIVLQAILSPSVVRGQDARSLLDVNFSLQEEWNGVINLSQSGAASWPWISIDNDGVQSVVWWDEYDGPQFSFLSKVTDWSEPIQMNFLAGLKTERGAYVKPQEWRLIDGDNNGTYLFWKDSQGILWSAQKTSLINTGWTINHQVAISPLVWDAAVDINGGLHVVYIQSKDNYTGQAGVYYIHSWTGESWTAPVLLDSSRYFRALTSSQAHVAIAVTGDGKVAITWQNAETGQTQLAASLDWGINFQIKEETQLANLVDNRQIAPRHVRPIATPENQFLLLWEAGGSCAMYQQMLTISTIRQVNPEVTETPEPLPPYSLSNAVRVLEDMSGCLGSIEPHIIDNKIILFTYQAGQSGGSGGSSSIILYDGAKWIGPIIPTVNFFDQSTATSVNLGCLDYSLGKNSVTVVGCDNRGDIWIAESTSSIDQLLISVPTAWSAPKVLSEDDALISSLPSAAGDGNGKVHVVWGETGRGLIHNSVFDQGIEGETVIQRESNANVLLHPNLTYAPDGRLYLLWSVGPGGRIYYSRAYQKDAGNSSGWEDALPISSQTIGGWPVSRVTDSGVIKSLFLVPLNENRGVYSSTLDIDQKNWSTPQVVYQPGESNYMIRDVDFASEANTLHAVWVESGLPFYNSALGVYYSKTSDGGQTWGKASRISFLDGDYPSIAISETGVVHVVWSRYVSGNRELWHQYSLDSGERWSEPKRLSMLANIAQHVQLIGDGNQGLYLTVVEDLSRGASTVTLLRWNGSEWGEREQVYLGAGYRDDGGIVSLLTSHQSLSVVYWAGNGVGVVSRELPGSLIINPMPTFTPRPTATITPTRMIIGTPSPAPTVDLSNQSNQGQRFLDWRLWVILTGMIVVVVISLVNLLKGRKQ